MAIDYNSALSRVAERTYDSTKNWRQSLRQRRSEYVDIYGIPFNFEPVNDAGTKLRAHIYISTDLEYYERLQFKLVIKSSQSIDPDDFTFKYGHIDDEDGNPRLVDCTDYLIAQHDDWVSGSGLGYYPSEVDSDETDDAADFYDMLVVCSDLMAEGNTAYKNRITRAGSKIAQIESNVPCEAQMLLYCKYSTVNR